ncbi:hypothetical protein E2C01_044856 [Portunus trituberculatus]|uniref:Uncharacterized protein n=1 Tax=Portunus trituberculatus TaxID=210409 RepID=A0A5B7G0K7_PORTR|nr:hypothetical protein [Portunus trituberculatus]
MCVCPFFAVQTRPAPARPDTRPHPGEALGPAVVERKLHVARIKKIHSMPGVSASPLDSVTSAVKPSPEPEPQP